MRRIHQIAFFASIGLFSLPASARRYGGGIDQVTSFAEGALEYLVDIFGPLVLAIGVCWAAFCVVFGRDGLQRAIGVIIAGVMLFSAEGLINFVRGLTGG